MLRWHIPKAGSTGWHRHHRSQLLYATEGLMVITTEVGVWMVPTGHALLVAPGIAHDSACEGPLELCTAYMEPGMVDETVFSHGCRMIRVSALLDAALRALAEESPDRAEAERGILLARLIVSEIELAEDADFAIPMPQDLRLRRICDALIDTPSLDTDIDSWSSIVGLSRRTLTRRFRAETSLTFGEWRRRLRAARAMIQQSEGQPLRAVAGKVGYRTAHGLQAMIERSKVRRRLSDTGDG
ncbi:helix-turn-helix domain-containing protein [Rhizobium puerariae]|uniref:Helix-turn-helix domain-containing protein n=1 Tax=Rhizobium puerariae TaxID=1585791 RepID=A0ABV6AUM1_9HYPH